MEIENFPFSEEDLNDFCDKLKLQKTKTKNFIDAVKYIIFKRTLKDIDEHELKEDLKMVCKDIKKINTFLDYIKENIELFSETYIQGDGLRLNIASVDWRIDLRLRDKYREKIYEPIILFRFYIQHKARDQEFFVEFNDKEFYKFKANIEKAHEQYLDILKLIKNKEV